MTELSLKLQNAKLILPYLYIVLYATTCTCTCETWSKLVFIKNNNHAASLLLNQPRTIHPLHLGLHIIFETVFCIYIYRNIQSQAHTKVCFCKTLIEHFQFFMYASMNI